MIYMIQGCEVSVTGVTIVKVNILTHIHSQVLLDTFYCVLTGNTHHNFFVAGSLIVIR